MTVESKFLKNIGNFVGILQFPPKSGHFIEFSHILKLLAGLSISTYLPSLGLQKNRNSPLIYPP